MPVHDVGRTEDGLCYVVSKFIEGSDLARQDQRESRSRTARPRRLVATIAEALHHAHLHMVVHRDVKPANILIDTQANPTLPISGWHSRKKTLVSGSGRAGTPAYMSPEQARGEGHLVDGRADIFSLGVVFYELLTASRPFWGDNREEVIERIRSLEVRPPRQLDDSIPKELERICLKALSQTGQGPLHHRSRHGGRPAALPCPDSRKSKPVDAARVEIQLSCSRSGDAAHPLDWIRASPSRSSPRGCGPSMPRMPISSWNFCPALATGTDCPRASVSGKIGSKRRTADKTFRVGLIYGPSGCGKSSLVKAGLLPRLAGHVISSLRRGHCR